MAVILTGNLPGVGDCQQIRVDHHGQGKDCLEIGFVPARKGAARIGSFKLGGRQDLFVAFLVGESAPVETAQLVVEDAPETDRERPVSDGRLFFQHQAGPFRFALVRDCGRNLPPPTPREKDLVEIQLDCVEDDLGGRFLDRDRDLNPACEGCRLQVGLDGEVIAVWDHVSG